MSPQLMLIIVIRLDSSSSRATRRKTFTRFASQSQSLSFDVHLTLLLQSLKYEIWASTDLGNKRLDRAFRESADKGPIYLFFSVNGRRVLFFILFFIFLANYESLAVLTNY